jgi:hypothetical protein
MMRFALKLATLALLLAGAGRAQADLLVTGYDITNAEPSGFGVWQHTYTGKMTPSGAGIYNYTGGGGTLNDGLIGTGTYNTQLFSIPADPAITVHLGSVGPVSRINLYSFANTSNLIPGNIVSVDVTINGVTQTFTPQGFGPVGASGFPVHEFLDLSKSPLGGLPTNTFTLSNVKATGSWSNYYSISEITVNAPAFSIPLSTPEPGGLALLGTGLAVLIGFARVRRLPVRRSGA